MAHKKHIHYHAADLGSLPLVEQLMTPDHLHSDSLADQGNFELFQDVYETLETIVSEQNKKDILAFGITDEKAQQTVRELNELQIVEPITDLINRIIENWKK